MAASAQPGARDRVRGFVQNLTIILLAFVAVAVVYWYFFLRTTTPTEVEAGITIVKQDPPPEPRAIEQNRIIFQDTFDASQESWEVALAGQGKVDRGSMILNDMAFEGEAFARPHLMFDNFVLNVHTRWLSGAVGGRYGVRFRLQDAENYYAFYLSNEGRYIIGESINGRWVEADAGFSDAIILGGGINLLQIEADGATLRFFINGVYITDMVDEAFGGGDIALVATKSGETDSYMVAFDNLTVGRLPE